MGISKVFFTLLISLLCIATQTLADSSACEVKEKHLAALDLAKESISKAKDLQPACGNDSKDTSSNSSECGAKEKVSAYLDIARNLIDNAQQNYSACDVKNITNVVLLHKKPMDCSEILENGESYSGKYEIWPRNRISDGKALLVNCDMDTDGGGWTVIQRRGNFSNKVDFYRNWNDYKHGFGNITEEFWIGNDNIFSLTNQRNYTVRFDLENVNNEYRFATYSSFWIKSEKQNYTVHFGEYNGTAGDGISSIRNLKFSTKDKDNGIFFKPHCTTKMGGWWYPWSCGLSNPNGINLPGVGKNDTKYMNWKPFTEYDSLLTIEIKIRPEN